MSRSISISVERRLYAESMGRCMNPKCKVNLFQKKGDIIEKAHIILYFETQDNSYENLIILCPNCHTNFDKNNLFDMKDIEMWKKIRGDEFEVFFSKKYDDFESLKNEIAPLLVSNKMIFENYFMEDIKKLWDTFEGEIISNNIKIKKILENNTHLIQSHIHEGYSNLALVRRFILHINEFEATRLTHEKTRQVLFPVEINSLFGIEPMIEKMMPSVESVECLIEILISKNEFESVFLGIENPYIQLKKNDKFEKIYLNDTPKLRQIYYDNDCFKRVNVRFESLNYALKIINNRGLEFKFLRNNNLKEITINNVKIVFIYEYCLNQVKLQQLCPEEKCVIVNLHNWNGSSCISQEAYELAEDMNVTLLTMKKFYGYLNDL